MTKKKMITILLAVMVLLSVVITMPSAEAAGNYTIRLAGADGSSTISAKPGDTVKLILSAQNNPGILSVGVQVSYPSDLSMTAQPKDVSGFSGVATVYKTFSPQLTSNPYLLWWNMPLGSTGKKLVTREGNLAEITFKVASDAQPGDYSITLVAPRDKNLTASTSGGVIAEDTNKDVSGISLVGCTVRVENTCAQGHSYGSWKDAGSGKHSRTCSACSATDTADHTWNSGTVTKQATCAEAGVKTYTCTTQGCGATKTENIDKVGHNYGSWKDAGNGKHSRTCSVCKIVESVDHTWDNGVVTKKPTCKDEGVNTYLCTVCRTTKAESIAKLNEHTYDNTCDPDCNICGASRTITHQYAQQWRQNKTGHWHQCTVCGDKKDTADHVPGAEATKTEPQKCKTCEYIITPALLHECKFASTWTTDEIGHWYACDACEEQGDYADHDFQNDCDPDCSVCGYVRQTAHAFGTEWTSDTTGHWYACTRCGEKADMGEHTAAADADESAAQTCYICGFEMSSLNDTQPDSTEASTEPSADGTNTNTNSNKILLWVVFIVFVTVAVSIAVLLIGKKRH